MTVTPRDWPERIRRSFEQISPRADELMTVFYDRLFVLRPETRALFASDMQVQRRHLVASLALIVRNLHLFDTLEASLRALGAEHANLGVRPEHYPALRQAMLEAFQQIVGVDWTDQLQCDWERLVDAVASQMLAGVEGGACAGGGASLSDSTIAAL